MAKVTSRIVAFKDFFVAVPVESAKLLRPVIASKKIPGDYDCFRYRTTEIEIGFMDGEYEEALGGGLYAGGFWIGDASGKMKFAKTMKGAIAIAERMSR